MTPSRIISSVVIFTIFAVCYSAKFPSYFPKCSKSDPSLEKCLTSSANNAWPTAVKGDKSVHIQKQNPLFVPSMSMEVANVIKGNLTDALILGMDTITFKSVKMDLEKKTIDVKFGSPLMKILGDYTITGKLFLLPIEGDGKVNITYVNIVADLHMEYSLKDKGDKKYVEIEKSSMPWTADVVYFLLTNLFGGDKTLGDAMNKVINDNWKELDNELGGRLGNTVGAVFADVLQSFFRRVPFDEFFTD